MTRIDRAELEAAALIALLVLAVSWTPGCAIRRAQVGTQAVLTSAAEGLQAGAEVVAGHVPWAVEGEGVEVYRARVAMFYEAADAFAASGAALRALQSALDVWIASGDLPAAWPQLCTSAGETIRGFLNALEAIGLDLPGALALVPVGVEQACALAAHAGEE